MNIKTFEIEFVTKKKLIFTSCPFFLFQAWILYVQEVLAHLYSNLLGQDFLGIQYVDTSYFFFKSFRASASLQR